MPKKMKKKATKKRAVKRKVRKVKAHRKKAVKAKAVKQLKETKVGVVEHFYDKISVAAIKVKGGLKQGDKIHIKGNTTDFTQHVESMQIEHEHVKSAKKGDAIGIKVNDKVRGHDVVYKVG